LAEPIRGLRQGLQDSGYVEGENLTIEYRWADNQTERLPAMAAELVRRRVSLIVATGGGQAPLAAKAATTAPPIVFNTADDLGAKRRPEQVRQTERACSITQAAM
jgi:putative ABC transport system substrate-binding protein